MKILLPYADYLRLTNTKPKVDDTLIYDDDECTIVSITDKEELWIVHSYSTIAIFPSLDHLFKRVEATEIPNGFTWTNQPNNPQCF